MDLSEESLIKGNVVPVELVDWLRQQLWNINKLNFEDIVWTEKDNILDIPKEVIRDFNFTGLSNHDFITTGYYKEKV